MQSSEHSPPPAVETAPATTVYEQPLTERMRTFLRLEFLYQQLLSNQERTDSWATRSAVASILEILAITARGDVRGDVLKDLERQMATMHEFKSKPGVDSERLHAVLANLARLRTELNSAGALFLQPLRDSEFLSAIKHRSSIPGGTCEFDLPDYRHWLQQPYELRAAAIDEWCISIRPLCDAVIELLWLTRATARPRREVATGGAFQLTLERETPCQLLRIILPHASALFPEISGSQHRCNIRFMQWTNPEVRPVQASADVSFMLTTCT